MTKLVVPPMPEVYTEADTEAQLDAVRVYRLDELRAYARTGWQTAQREAALADELAEALEKASDCFRELVPSTTSGYKPNRLAKRGLELSSDALRTYTAARQMNKEARNG